MRKEYDFSQAERAGDIPHLAHLQTAAGDKPIVMVHIDADIIDDFERRREAGIGGIDGWVNQALRDWISAHPGQ